MQERDRETVVVEGDRRPTYGWLIALAVIVLLIILFFAFGGMNLFNGASGDTTNINAPETIEVQPTPQQ
ncbi:MAG: hypothetical protein ACREGE_02950 [Candidatus Microsaccharimonas sp.]